MFDVYRRSWKYPAWEMLDTSVAAVPTLSKLTAINNLDDNKMTYKVLTEQ